MACMSQATNSFTASRKVLVWWSMSSFEVTGDFNDKDVFTALQKAGLTGQAGN